MNNITLIQVDGKMPNLALMKISAWHKSIGDSITLIKSNDSSSRLIHFDKVYISCIFEKNRQKALNLAKQFKNVEIGGIGLDYPNHLPSEIEHMMPDYETFKCDYSIGFTTRGCFRQCKWCKVPKVEGMIKIHCDIYEFWNKKHKQIILMDNNILALPDHFKKIAEQIKENNLYVDFNQGLDHRLLTPEICKTLLELKHIHEIRFAFDHISYKNSVIKALEMLKKQGLKDWGSRWYLYIGEDDTFETVYERMNLLHDNKQAVYVMRDEKVYDKPEYIALASWGNTMGAFKQDLKDLLKHSERIRCYKGVLDRYLNSFEKQKDLKRY